LKLPNEGKEAPEEDPSSELSRKVRPLSCKSSLQRAELEEEEENGDERFEGNADDEEEVKDEDWKKGSVIMK